MNLNRFESGRQQRWSALEALVVESGSRPEKLGSAKVRTMARLYRATCADLAFARLHYPDTPVVTRLEALVTAGRFVVYDRPSRRGSILRFLTTGYWQLIYERRALVLLAGAALFLPAVFGFVFGFQTPDAAMSRLPEGFQWVQTAETTDQGLNSVGLAAFSVFILTNNITVTLLTFVYGISLGFGTLYLLITNGFVLGATAGLAVEASNTRLLIAAIAGHGTLELSCIVIGGASGLALGRSIINPGLLTRRASLATEGVKAAQIFIGTALVLVVAGFLEGYLSRTGITWIPVLIVGMVLLVGFWGLVVWRGRQPTDEQLFSPAGRKQHTLS